MEQIYVLAAQAVELRDKCMNIRKLLDEGTSKLDSSLVVVNNLKKQEENFISTAEEPQKVKLLSEEQIDGILDMIKTPAFQNIAKQMLLKWLDK